MISHTHRFVFVHIPRTGGTSIEAAFRNPDHRDKHWRPHSIIASIGACRWRHYFKFTFVRNPFDWLVSWYFFKLKWEGMQPIPFREFVFTRPIRPQTEWLEDRPMDFVGRFENLHQDFASVCRTLGVRLRLPHRMATTHRPYASYYDAATRERVMQLYAPDFQAFDYAF